MKLSDFFKISIIYSFEIIGVVIADPRIFFRIAGSVAEAAAVDANGIKTLLAMF